jgi:hypothetical protein
MLFLLVPMLIVVAIVIAATWIHNRRVDGPHTVHLVAFVLGCVLGGFFSVFVAGETLGDPGGWLGAGFVALWAVPMAAAMAVALRRPDAATWILGTLTGAVVALGAWFAFAPDSWRSFEDGHGPVRAIVLFAMVLPLTMLGRRRPMAAGVMMVVATVAPLVLATMATVGGEGVMVLTAIGSPVTIVGALFVLAALMGSDSVRRRVEVPPPKGTAPGAQAPSAVEAGHPGVPEGESEPGDAPVGHGARG